MQLEGTVCPMPTPTTGRSVNCDALAKYTRYLSKSGVNGLFPCGSIGEFSSLTRSQRVEVLETVVDHSENVPVLAGCGNTSAGDVREHVREAATVGVDAAVVVTPYYLNTTQDGLERFFEVVANDSPLPIILYNIPALTGECLSVELVERMADHPNVVGLKDTSGDLTFLYNVVEATPPQFDIFQGASQLAVASLDIGVSGLIAGPANVFPRSIVQLYECYQEGDHERVQRLMRAVINPVVSAIDDVPTAAAMKYLVSLAGYDIGTTLPPLPKLNAEQRKTLDQCYESVVASTAV